MACLQAIRTSLVPVYCSAFHRQHSLVDSLFLKYLRKTIFYFQLFHSQTDALQCLKIRLNGLPAGLAEPAYQALGQDGIHR